MSKANQEVREAAKKAGLHLYELAHLMGLNECVFSKRLRYELPPEMKEQALKFCRAIEEGGKTE